MLTTKLQVSLQGLRFLGCQLGVFGGGESRAEREGAGRPASKLAKPTVSQSWVHVLVLASVPVRPGNQAAQNPLACALCGDWGKGRPPGPQARRSRFTLGFLPVCGIGYAPDFRNLGPSRPRSTSNANTPSHSSRCKDEMSLNCTKAYGHSPALCRKLAVFDTWSSLAVHIAMDNTVVMEEISKWLRVSVDKKVEIMGSTRTSSPESPQEPRRVLSVAPCRAGAPWGLHAKPDARWTRCPLPVVIPREERPGSLEAETGYLTSCFVSWLQIICERVLYLGALVWEFW